MEAEGFGFWIGSLGSPSWGTEREHHGRAGSSWISLLWMTFPLVLCSFAVCFNNPSLPIAQWVLFSCPNKAAAFITGGQYFSLCFLFPLCDGVTMVTNIYCISRALGLFFSRELSRAACKVPGSVRQGGQSALCIGNRSATLGGDGGSRQREGF